MDMNQLVRQAQEMKEKISRIQDELSRRTVSSSAGGGMVTVTANGAMELVGLKLEKEVVNPNDLEMLTDLILSAANEALKRAQEMVTQEMGRITGGLVPPGLI